MAHALVLPVRSSRSESGSRNWRRTLLQGFAHPFHRVPVRPKNNVCLFCFYPISGRMPRDFLGSTRGASGARQHRQTASMLRAGERASGRGGDTATRGHGDHGDGRHGDAGTRRHGDTAGRALPLGYRRSRAARLRRSRRYKVLPASEGAVQALLCSNSARASSFTPLDETVASERLPSSSATISFPSA